MRETYVFRQHGAGLVHDVRGSGLLGDVVTNMMFAPNATPLFVKDAVYEVLGVHTLRVVIVGYLVGRFSSPVVINHPMVVHRYVSADDTELTFRYVPKQNAYIVNYVVHPSHLWYVLSNTHCV